MADNAPRPDRPATTDHVRLIAGSAGPERRPPRPDPAEPRWYEPLHVRDAAAARERVAAIVVAGADVVVAPVWLTHRRALLPIGETRRARAWTAAAIRIARDGTEIGLERRSRLAAAPDAAAADDPWRGRDLDRATPAPDPIAIPRLPVLVAGWLPPIDGAPEPGSGRLAAPDVAVSRDLRAQAGLLVEAGAELLVAEVAGGIDGARHATEAAAETGLPTWTTGRIGGTIAEPTFPGGTDPAAWADAVVEAGGAAILIDGPVEIAAAAMARIAAALTVPVGIVGVGADGAARALEAGARHVGALDGASPGAIGAIRAAIDAQEGARRTAAAHASAAWAAIVANAARRAPGGAAGWIEADGGADERLGHVGGGMAGGPRSLPGGFAWVTVPGSAAGSLPDGRFRLIVVDGAVDVGLALRLGSALEPGGILVTRVAAEASAAIVSGAGERRLRVVDVAAAGAEVGLILRREG